MSLNRCSVAAAGPGRPVFVPSGPMEGGALDRCPERDEHDHPVERINVSPVRPSDKYRFTIDTARCPHPADFRANRMATPPLGRPMTWFTR